MQKPWRCRRKLKRLAKLALKSVTLINYIDLQARSGHLAEWYRAFLIIFDKIFLNIDNIYFYKFYADIFLH